MKSIYHTSKLAFGVKFLDHTWFATRQANSDVTSIIWLKNDRAIIDDWGMYNAKTPIMIFLN